MRAVESVAARLGNTRANLREEALAELRDPPGDLSGEEAAGLALLQNRLRREAG